MSDARELYDAMEEVVEHHRGAAWWRQRRPVFATTTPTIQVDDRTWRSVGRHDGRYLYTLRQAQEIRERLIQHMAAVYEGRLDRLVFDSTDML